ncbi:hypothetical protein IV203_038540 [Nitzschia inconspicua]|uniref:Uncharacterized protein n=1 Tax=Nitzschia inconspicua TaxID=303405 RepID=A0A9K3PZ37_9STRA|nr:hypothetical protein IV203_038540 [Nitzschia inconspicua]
MTNFRQSYSTVMWRKRTRCNPRLVFFQFLMMASLYSNGQVCGFHFPKHHVSWSMSKAAVPSTTVHPINDHSYRIRSNVSRHATIETARPALSNPRKVGGIQFQRFKIDSTSDRSSMTTIRSTTDRSSNGPLQSSAGFFFALAVILTLGLTNTVESQSFLGFSVDSDNELNEVAIATAERVIDASVPTSSSAYLAVALGESIGGIIGAAFSVLINVLLRQGMIPWSWNRKQDQEDNGILFDLNNIRKQPIVSQAISDGDYFIANSATDSLLVAIGVAPEVAKLSSVFIAAVPSQLVKLAPKLREQRKQEDLILQQLLQEQQKQQRPKVSQQYGFFAMIPGFSSAITNTQSTMIAAMNPSQLVPVTGTIELDFVEVFADITRWLEYDVLKSEFAGTLQWNNEVLDPSMAGAVLGALAAVSSRFYADVLYGQFQYGPLSKQEEVRSRRSIEWASLYFTTAASAATLFGFYEFAQRPIFRWIQGTLAGGVEGCIGSTSFDACLQTYIDANAPGPSPEAQFRALATNLIMVVQRLQLIAVDTSFDDVAALVRAWTVSFVSYWHQLTTTLPASDNLPSSIRMLLGPLQ